MKTFEESINNITKMQERWSWYTDEEGKLHNGEGALINENGEPIDESGNVIVVEENFEIPEEFLKETING